ncbi:hypothetical protein Tsubulata_033067 [Turnera subulata]|uniref:DUF4283 domain-containing protein n=1 Tax=Turnera subulata TaxID=218843 RepID=A0A9Q0GBB8_9ROSI|nr:hypothetical protein Tsubulata_033067 [Turnera subulata]
MRVLTRGPWMILGLYLSVKRWRPNFNPSTHRVSSVVAWVRIPSLPAEHYHVGVLRLVCDQIGRTVQIDLCTQQTDRAQFARIVVELDLTKPLESRVCFEGFWYHIEYEDLPQICFECGMARHNMTICPSRAQATNMDTTTTRVTPNALQDLVNPTSHPSQPPPAPRAYGDVVNEPKYGKLMLVSWRKPQTQKAHGNGIDRRDPKLGSTAFRFDVLAVDEDAGIQTDAVESQTNAVVPKNPPVPT